MDPRRLLPTLGLLACACVVATLVVALARPDAPGDGPATPPGGRPVATAAVPSGPAAILAAWDARRAAAWAAGDAGTLRSLYAAGSRAGAADLRLLRHYRARGLRVEGLRTQVLALDVVERSARRLVLVVTDRVAGGEAVGRAGRAVALPVDRASTRRIVLVRPRAAWLVAEALDQASAAASTSRTSSSSKS